jgi:ATP-dependent Lon protease
MHERPDASLRARAMSVAPLFPLPGVFLYPGAVMPLFIFEPRYRCMIEDLLDGPGRLVMGTVHEDHAHELAGSPPVLEVAGLGEIARHVRRDDGCFDILLVGMSRVKIREVASDRPYRRVETESLSEKPVPRETHDALRDALHRAILSRCNELLNLPAQMPVSNLADLLVQRIDLPQASVARLYAELDVEKRARAALDEHARRPLPPPAPSTSPPNP